MLVLEREEALADRDRFERDLYEARLRIKELKHEVAVVEDEAAVEIRIHAKGTSLLQRVWQRHKHLLSRADESLTSEIENFMLANEDVL